MLFSDTSLSKEISARFLEMSRSTTKLTKWPVRPAKTHVSLGTRPVWSVFAVRLMEVLGPHLPIKRISKTLIRLGGCTGWTGYSLGHMSFFPVQKSSNALPCMQYAYALPFSMRQKMLRASKYRNTNSLIISTQNTGFTPEQCIIEPQHDKTCLREFPTRPVCAVTEAS